MDLGLTGLKAVVLGGTRGIGRATVETLLEEGCHVAFCARGAEGVQNALAEIDAPANQTVWGEAADMADGPAIKGFVEKAAGELGGIDILISNASALALGSGEEAFRANFEVDLMGLVRAVDAALPHLKESGKGAIVAVSSISGVERRTADAYGTIKTAQVPYVKGLAVQHAKHNIRANLVSPGTIYFEGGVWGWMKENMRKEYDEALARNPMGRMGAPEEMARAIVFLASPAASFVTGTNLIADGAMTTRVQL